MKKTLVAVSFIVAIIVLVQLTMAVAFAKPEAIKISPLILKYSINKGEKDSGTFSVTNPNRFKINIKTESEDFLQGDEIGTPAFFPKGAGATGLASWIKIIPKKLSLDPLETKDVDFFIDVPKDAEPGGHYAAVFAKNVAGKGKGQTQIAVSGRVGTLVLVTVPGAITQTGKIAEFNGPRLVNSGPIDFKVRFRNTGTVHYTPKGSIEINSILGSKLTTMQLADHIVLPKSIRALDSKWDTGFRVGIYKANLKMVSGENESLSKSLIFVMFPWQQALFILGGLILIYFARRSFKKKYKIVKNT